MANRLLIQDSDSTPHAPPEGGDRGRDQRRPPWRQKLVEAERGVVLGFRRDSALFVDFFLSVVSITAGIVLGLSVVEWAILALALTMVFVAELFNQMVKSLVDESLLAASSQVKKTLRLGTAAAFLAVGGAGLAITLMFAHRIVEAFVE